MPLPTDRTTANTAAEHVADHNTLHGEHNLPTHTHTTEAVAVVAASGAAQTLPEVAVATISRITLTANCTFTFPTAAAGRAFTLVLIQDGTGSRLAVWPGSVKWPAAVAPTLSTGAGKVDYLSFVCTDGTTWAGFIGGLDIR